MHSTNGHDFPNAFIQVLKDRRRGQNGSRDHIMIIHGPARISRQRIRSGNVRLANASRFKYLNKYK
jgi:hypothetical protein